MQPLAFIDLETTGGTATVDRITEIGIVEVDADGVREWSTLVNPQTSIPPFIQRLTGINEAMVAHAPAFAEVANDVLTRLEGRLFVAHNARFDHGFLKNEFKRLGIDFKTTVLCTVRLSRHLYPDQTRHGLDALIARHGLSVTSRHRALDDARVLWQFWQKARAEVPEARFNAEVAALTARPNLPPHLDPALVDDLPDGPGVYLFYGENDLPLYIGKSITLKKRVLSHFRADHASAKEMSLCQQVRRIEWIESSGELGALLTEAALVKKLQPTHNRRLRRQGDLCTWRLRPETSTGRPELVWARDLDLGQQDHLYGLFRNQREAQTFLRKAAAEHGLCLAVLGLEKVATNRSCFAHQLKQCKGACVGKEPLSFHTARLSAALARQRLAQWPYGGPIAIREGDSLHLVDGWRYLGAARSDDEARHLLEAGQSQFDADTYKLLVKHLSPAKVEVLRLTAPCS